MIVTSPDYVKSRYKLSQLKALETLVADAVQIVRLSLTRLYQRSQANELQNIPFNSPVTGFCAVGFVLLGLQVLSLDHASNST